ncbi:hypothetical protein [Methanobacterium sp.]|uniref:hypothetical protein n=1 Tax=Methanobacterium sp. TaxID=2164 RepID=UPI0025E4637D|nr:hypothetical protein [Methanobacterium sp.]MBI5459887.1 hypothetical protein [Methanobacterium sp.]
MYFTCRLTLNILPPVNAATTNTVEMQKTGTPLAGMVLAILMVLGGFLVPGKNNRRDIESFSQSFF